jgi:hypothetical protein
MSDYESHPRDCNCRLCSQFHELIPNERAAAIYLLLNWIIAGMKATGHNTDDDAVLAFIAAMDIIGITDEELQDAKLANQLGINVH